MGDYEDSAEYAEKCYLGEIDACLQGRWSAEDGSIVMDYSFDQGRFKASMTIGTSSIGNEGSYRIDMEKNEIYVCYDYTYSTSGSKTSNTKEQLMFTFTYDGEELVMTNTSDIVLERK